MGWQQDVSNNVSPEEMVRCAYVLGTIRGVLADCVMRGARLNGGFGEKFIALDVCLGMLEGACQGSAELLKAYNAGLEAGVRGRELKQGND